MRPLLLLDVDGVLNCFGSFWTPEYESKTFMSKTFDIPEHIRIPLSTAERLAMLGESFEMTWCTAWEERAHPYFGPILGLGTEWPYVRFSSWDGRTREGRSWKWSFVDRYVDYSGDAPRPAAWIDDDLHPGDFEWASARTAGGQPTLLVKTDPSFGLQDTHVTQLMEFADSLRANSKV